MSVTGLMNDYKNRPDILEFTQKIQTPFEKRNNQYCYDDDGYSEHEIMIKDRLPSSIF